MPRLAILSDIHIERWKDAFQMPSIDADLLVVAGDVLEARVGSPVAWLLDNTHPNTPVIFVPGNHDFFGGVVDDLLSQWKREARGSHVHVLYNDQEEIAGLRVLGTTLWSGLALHRNPIHEAGLRRELPQKVKDFMHIRQDNRKTWSVRAMLKEHQNCVRFLTENLARPDPRALVVTHWPAHRQSMDPRFSGSMLEPYFSNHYPDMVSQAGLWIHGHTHHPFDYREGVEDSLGRVYCNPLGLPVERDEWGHPLEPIRGWEDRLYLQMG